MSTRQKSFFDQKPKPKYSKPQWPRHRPASHTHPHNPNAPPLPRQAVTGPPIMPSTQTRTKLKSFQFIEGAPALDSAAMEHEQEKENMSESRKVEQTPRTSKTADVDEQHSVETPNVPPPKQFPPPSTPATRLPLADLVGNGNESSRHALKPIASPDEQLCWRGSQPVNTPLPRKGKKRARSSSPVAPSQEDLPADLPGREMTTPLADPGKELWNRYANIKGTPTLNKSAAFAHLINEASPRSSAQAGSVSGLRRWASCGVEFPTSATKRRKTQGAFRVEGGRKTDDGFGGAPSSDGVIQAQPDHSKRASIVQRLIEASEASRPAPNDHAHSAPSSSSPLPEVRDRTVHTSACESPLRHHPRLPQIPECSDPDQDVEMEVIEEDDPLPETRQPSQSSDEFNDPDFDSDMVETLDIDHMGESIQNVVPAEAEVLEAAPEPVDADEMVLDDNPKVDSEDEFGLDEDLFAADMEMVASLFDSRQEESSGNTLDHTQGGTEPVLPNNPAAHVINLVDDDSDDFGDDDIGADELIAAELTATQAHASNSQQDTRAIQRYLIKRVVEGSYTTERGYAMPEKILVVEEEKTKLFKAITLRQSWYDTPCTPDSYVHVIGTFSRTGQCVIDDRSNMLILHPDHLISATVVADSFGCLRRAVLQDRIKATSKANAPMLHGTLLHELFQEAMKVNRWDSAFLLETIDKLLPSKFETILEISSSCEQVKDHLRSKLPELQAWAEVFVRAEPRGDAIVTQRNGKQAIMSINKLLDVEEHVWSPMYGLKGNIDATVQVTMDDDQGRRTLTVPFEVKTGKNSSNSAHVAQTALYNLLLSNRYDVDVAYGILYYLETSAISRIPAIRTDIIHMIIKRNELACYVRDRIELPPMLKEDFKCGNCYAQESCFIYHKLVEDGEGEMLNKKAKEKYDDLVKALNPADNTFMKMWDSLLTKEESVMMRFRRELWSMLSTEREKLGRCFSNVMLEPGSGHEEKNGQKINRYSYTFIKEKAEAGFSFTESQLIIGEPIVVSDEKGHFALANGYVTNVRKRRITVAVDRRLHNARTKMPGFNSQSNQTFTGIMEVGKEGEPLPSTPNVDEEPVLYRLDKDEFSNGMAAARNNLVQIMDDNVYKARDLRSLIVNNRPPVFRPAPDSNAFPSSSQMAMNADQKAAVTKVMSAKDYALVLGMPGTGKTTTIAHIIRALVAKGKSVLLTSYTHTAVDNILLKIRNENIGILRLGASAKIHPEVREFATLACEPKDSLEELEKTWMEPPVVATTCLTINHPLFSRRIFDYCIVDEASQITLPVCIGPIRMARAFVLVGDHYQLPPLVQNKEAAEGGLDVSLFKLLCEAHPQAVVSLEHQYRMCAEIMLLSNTFIYSDRMKCGTSTVASRKLSLPNHAGLQSYHRQSTRSLQSAPCSGPESFTCWLSRALDPSNPVIFINTDAISPILETQFGSRITNTLESRLITHLTVSLISMGVSASEIGAIAFYRSQLALLRQSLSSAHTQTQSSELAAPALGPGTAGVELHTADKFQGRDKEVVLVSCVRSNEAKNVGDLLKDRRRINVALTRARSKLIIVGSERTLSENELLADLIALCRGKGWVLDLSSDMVDGHSFDEAITQTGVSGLAPKGLSEAAHNTKTISPPSTPSPTKKRKVLGDVSITAQGKMNQRMMKTPLGSQEGGKKKGLKTPKKVVKVGQRGILDGSGVLRDVFYEAI